MKRAKPTIWLAFGLVSLTVMLAIMAYSIGLMPNDYRAELEARAKVAEALAVQVANAANRNDSTTVSDTLSAVVTRNDDVLSAALRKPDGTLLVSQGDHDTHWVAPEGDASTPTHVQVPLMGGEGPQGQMEMVFVRPSAAVSYFGIPRSVWLFIGFIAAAGFLGYYVLLRRTLKQLDPGRVVPERVQRAFDTVSDGVAILDERQRILLVNDAFAHTLGYRPERGTNINKLAWRMPDGAPRDGGYVWHTAIRERREVRGDTLALRTKGGTLHNLSVGAAVITGERDEVIGAIVTLGDQTRLKRSEEDLARTAAQLAEREAQVTQQTQELQYLATHDTLSGCLNRRTFLSRLERRLADHDGPVALLVVEIDHFQAITDDHGPAVTDRLVTGMGTLLKGIVPEGSVVARHRGEEFVICLDGAGKEGEALARAVREEVTRESETLLPGHRGLSVSIGIATSRESDDQAYGLVRRADQALGEALGERSRRGILPVSVPLPVPVARDRRASDEGREVEQEARLAIFERQLTRSLARAEQADRPFAVVKMRIASFDYLSEALGEALTAKVVEEVGRKAHETLRGQDDAFVLAQNGELLIELSELVEPGDVAFTVSRLMDRMREPIRLAGRDIYIASKIGAALFPDDGRDVPTLVRHASIALRRAVQEGELESFRFYNVDMTQASEWRMNVESGIREALANDQFELFFQPIVCARTSKVSAAEALLRCNNERLAGIPIDQIVAVAEQSTLSEEIDEWVVRGSLAQMQEWCDTGLSLPKVSINVSARQLSNVAFMEGLYTSIEAVRFSPTRVQIEVTETAKLADIEIAAPQLKRLQGLGVQIALDDFGTGQASLSYLQRLHPDTLKVDRSFIKGVTVNHANATMVAAMTVMAHCLGVRVVVEGVEEEEQLDFLRETGCDDIQGYLISRPLPSRVMTQWLDLFVRENGAREFVAALEEAPLASGEVRPGPARAA